MGSVNSARIQTQRWQGNGSCHTWACKDRQVYRWSRRLDTSRLAVGSTGKSILNKSRCRRSNTRLSSRNGHYSTSRRRRNIPSLLRSRSCRRRSSGPDCCSRRRRGVGSKKIPNPPGSTCLGNNSAGSCSPRCSDRTNRPCRGRHHRSSSAYYNTLSSGRNRQSCKAARHCSSAACSRKPHSRNGLSCIRCRRPGKPWVPRSN